MKLKKACSVVAVSLLAFIGCAETSAQSEANSYKPPTNIRELCRKYEDYIKTVYNAMIAVNSKLPLAATTAERKDLLAESESYQRGIDKREESWQRLGCAQILYGSAREQAR